MRLKVKRLGNVPCHTYRRFVLKHIYKMDIGKNVLIYGGFEFISPWNIKIGKGSIVGNGAILDGRNGITIGENVNLSHEVWIWTVQHDAQDADFKTTDKGQSVSVNDRAWLCGRTVVLPGVTVGEGAVLATGAVASKPLDAFKIYAGVPAREIGPRNKELRYELDGDCLPFI